MLTNSPIWTHFRLCSRELNKKWSQINIMICIMKGKCRRRLKLININQHYIITNKIVYKRTIQCWFMCCRKSWIILWYIGEAVITLDRDILPVQEQSTWYQKLMTTIHFFGIAANIPGDLCAKISRLYRYNTTMRWGRVIIIFVSSPVNQLVCLYHKGNID